MIGAEGLIESSEIEEDAGEGKRDGRPDFEQPRIHGIERAFVAVAGLQFVKIADVGQHRGGERPQRTEPEGYEQGRDEKHPRMGRGVAPPFDQVADQGENKRQDERVPFTNARGDQTDQRHEEKAADLPSSAAPSGQNRSRSLLTCVDIIDGEVNGQTADAENPEAHEKDRATEDDEGPVAHHRLDLRPDRFGGTRGLRGGLLFAAEKDGDQGETRHEHGKTDSDPACSGNAVGKDRQLDQRVKPRQHNGRRGAHERVGRHQPRAFVVVGRNGQSHRAPWHGKEGHEEVKDRGEEQEIPELPHLAP